MTALTKRVQTVKNVSSGFPFSHFRFLSVFSKNVNKLSLENFVSMRITKTSWFIRGVN